MAILASRMLNSSESLKLVVTKLSIIFYDGRCVGEHLIKILKYWRILWRFECYKIDREPSLTQHQSQLMKISCKNAPKVTDISTSLSIKVLFLVKLPQKKCPRVSETIESFEFFKKWFIRLMASLPQLYLSVFVKEQIHVSSEHIGGHQWMSQFSWIKRDSGNYAIRS